MPLCKCPNISLGIQHTAGFADAKAGLFTLAEELDTEMPEGQSREPINTNHCTKWQAFFWQYYFSIHFSQDISTWKPASLCMDF